MSKEVSTTANSVGGFEPSSKLTQLDDYDGVEANDKENEM